MIHKRFLLVLIVPLLALIAAGATAGAPNPLPDQQAPELKLRAGTFVPSVQGDPAIPETLKLDNQNGEAGYYIVQFGGPVQEAWKKGIERAGGKILEYLPITRARFT